MSQNNNYDPKVAIKNLALYHNKLKQLFTFDIGRLSPMGLDILRKKYCSKEYGEKTIEDCFSRVALAFSDNYEMAQQVYHDFNKLWFIGSTPVYSNGGLIKKKGVEKDYKDGYYYEDLLKIANQLTDKNLHELNHRGIPISCYLNESGTTMEDKINNINENIRISANWGGIGTLIDGIASKDLMVYCKMLESINWAFYNDDRKSSLAVYLSISHAGIEEFLEMRRPVGGDHRTKCLNLHHGIIIPDAFFESLKNKKMWSLYENDGTWVRDIDPLTLWNRIVKIRFETGEPYLLFSDRLKEATPEYHKRQGMEPKTSNLCSEITLYTSEDRTAVCCLSSLNLAYYDEWKNDEFIIERCLRFLDNVLSYTKYFFKDELPRAFKSIEGENAVGLGVMGFHTLLQKKNIPIESQEAADLNEEIFSWLKNKALEASRKLAQERGACLDAQVMGVNDSRFSYMLAIAPTANISHVGNCSPGIEPYMSNIMTIKNGMGNYNYLNPTLLEVLNENLQFKNSPEFADKVIKSISKNKGSVQHLDFLTDLQKATFKTFFEIDQMKLVELAAQRQKYICQSQSLNLCFSADKTIADISKVLIKGYQKGVKTFYYSRTESILRAEGVEEDINLNNLDIYYKQSMDNAIVCEGCI